VKVTFRLWNEVVVHETINYTLPDMIKLCSLGVQPGGLANPINWAEGVVFRFSAMPMNEAITKELLQGIVHWNSVEWAPMPQYQNVIQIADINAKIPVIDQSETKIICEVIRALKEHSR